MASIIGAVGVILAALITVWGKKNSKKKKKNNYNSLTGHWNCEWWDSNNNKSGYNSTDKSMASIFLHENLDNKVAGEGTDVHGKYMIEGNMVNKTLLLLGYRGEEQGEIKLIVDENNLTMSGTWTWHFSSGDDGGKTKWTKSQ